jgi:hypothetical protein
MVGEFRAYRVMVVEDQITDEAVAAALEQEQRAPGDAALTLAGSVARNEDDAIVQLELMFEAGTPPDAIVLDDYLSDGPATASRSLHVMSWLCRRCINDDIPVHARPRAVLWTSCEPELVYTFCVLGGLQFQDKRGPDGLQVPVRAIRAALRGERWQPRPYPETGLDRERFRAPLPWVEAGWQIKTIAARALQPDPRHPHEATLNGVTLDTLETTRNQILKMPRTPKEGDGFPANLPMAAAAAKRNGWVWVPLKWHHHIPSGAPLPIVIDPAAQREQLPPAGPG